MAGVRRSCGLSFFVVVIKNQIGNHTFINLFDLNFCIYTMWRDSNPQLSGDC